MCVGRSWNRCRGPVVISERSCMGVKDPNRCKRPAVLSKKVLHGCERLAVLFKKFCMGVRDGGEIRKFLLPKRKYTVMFTT